MGCCGNNKTSLKVTTQQIKELAKTTKDVIIEAVKTGEIKAKADIIQHRQNTCKQCPKLRGWRCEVCGCVVDAKTLLKISKCPLSLW